MVTRYTLAFIALCIVSVQAHGSPFLITLHSSIRTQLRRSASAMPHLKQKAVQYSKHKYIPSAIYTYVMGHISYYSYPVMKNVTSIENKDNTFLHNVRLGWDELKSDIYNTKEMTRYLGNQIATKTRKAYTSYLEFVHEIYR